MGFAHGRDDPMTGVQIVAVFGVGMVAGLAIGLLVGNWIGYYSGKLYERKRISRLIAKKTAIEIVQALSQGETEQKKRQPQAQPRDGTRH